MQTISLINTYLLPIDIIFLYTILNNISRIFFGCINLTESHKDNPKVKEKQGSQNSTDRKQFGKFIPLQTSKGKKRKSYSARENKSSEDNSKSHRKIISKGKDWALIKELVPSAQLECKISYRPSQQCASYFAPLRMEMDIINMFFFIAIESKVYGARERESAAKLSLIHGTSGEKERCQRFWG